MSARSDAEPMDSEPHDVASLRDRCNAVSRLEYLFFWGHTPATGEVGKECLSQWYPAAFSVDGVTYATAEHFMMAEKARLFGDEGMRRSIIASPDPGAAKELGRTVCSFDEQVWASRRAEIVVAGNAAKFGQNVRLRDFLVGTGDRVLVEASPTDAVWGIGLAADDPRAADPLQWRGLNLLGFALMAVRSQLRRPRGA